MAASGPSRLEGEPGCAPGTDLGRERAFEIHVEPLDFDPAKVALE